MKRRSSCGAGSSKESVDKTLESEVKDEHPVVNSVAKSLGGTVPTVLSQLRKGSVEQASVYVHIHTHTQCSLLHMHAEG